MNRRQSIKAILATGSIILYSWYNLPAILFKKNAPINQQLPFHFIGLGGAGAQIAKHFHAQGISAKFSIVSTVRPKSLSSEIAFVQYGAPTIIDRFSERYTPILIRDEVRMNDQLTNKGDNAEPGIPDAIKKLLKKDEHFILLAGLGGHTGSSLMRALTLKLHEEDKMFHSFCSLPFRFEGTERRETAAKALSAIRQFKNVHFFELESLRRKHPDLVLSNAFERGNEEFLYVYNKLNF